jgi:hypothetical protein
MRPLSSSLKSLSGENPGIPYFLPVSADKGALTAEAEKKNKPVTDDPATGDNWTFEALERNSKAGAGMA